MVERNYASYDAVRLIHGVVKSLVAERKSLTAQLKRSIRKHAHHFDGSCYCRLHFHQREAGIQRISEIPLQRFGKPHEVAAMIHFLCGSGSTFITGQVINIDGGVVNS